MIHELDDFTDDDLNIFFNDGGVIGDGLNGVVTWVDE